MKRAGGIAVLVDEEHPREYTVRVRQSHERKTPTKLPGGGSYHGLDFAEGKVKRFTSKSAAIAYGKGICRRIEKIHPYEPNSPWNASLIIDSSMGKKDDGIYMCIKQKFIEYYNVR